MSCTVLLHSQQLLLGILQADVKHPSGPLKRPSVNLK